MYRREAYAKLSAGASSARSHGGPPLFALSWAFWLLVFAAALAVPARRLARHDAEMALGHRTREVRREICLTMSPPPRPGRVECLARAMDADMNLIAPRTM